jgi:gamma-glutamylcyclotransferase (GGCT)/AIG2-like uncharacterized protein YtfP
MRLSILRAAIWICWRTFAAIAGDFNRRDLGYVIDKNFDGLWEGRKKFLETKYRPSFEIHYTFMNDRNGHLVGQVYANERTNYGDELDYFRESEAAYIIETSTDDPRGAKNSSAALARKIGLIYSFLGQTVYCIAKAFFLASAAEEFFAPRGSSVEVSMM